MLMAPARTAMNATITSPLRVPGGTLTAMLDAAVDGALVLTERSVGGEGVAVGVAVGESVGKTVGVGVEVAVEVAEEDGVVVGVAEVVAVGVGELPLPKAATIPCQLELAERATPVPKEPGTLAVAYR